MSNALERVKSELAQAVSQMIETANAFPWTDKKAYADLIAQTYFYSRHTTRILGLAGVHFPLDQNQLHYRFLRHAAEETGHENIAIKDLKTLGFKPEQFAERPATMALYQTQYYWVQHEEPASIYGYILALEGFAAKHCRTMYETCKEAHGDEASVFWKIHSEDDPDHLEKALAQVGQLPEGTLEKVRVNLIQTASYYCEIFNDIRSRTATIDTKLAHPERLLKTA